MPRLALPLAAALCLIAAAPAIAAEARCYNSDDGDYDCRFSQFGGDGSFVVSAPMRPTYTLEMLSDGVASAFGDFGSGNRFLPGPFLRSRTDPACWISEATGFALCVY